MEKKYVLISMEDERVKHLSEVLGNKTCKKIIDFLADNKEASEKDLADVLNLPMNTVEYNLKKLIKAELIEKSRNFFWSKKGKRIEMYKLSNKSIIISPSSSRVSSKLKSILPVALIGGIGALAVKVFFYSQQTLDSASQAITKASETAVSLANPAPILSESVSSLLNQSSPSWVWFLAGTLFNLVLFTILNWRKL